MGQPERAKTPWRTPAGASLLSEGFLPTPEAGRKERGHFSQANSILKKIYNLFLIGIFKKGVCLRKVAPFFNHDPAWVLEPSSGDGFGSVTRQRRPTPFYGIKPTFPARRGNTLSSIK